MTYEQDNIINQKVLVRQLQAKGFRTSAANDGQEALDILLGSTSDIDVVLMDIVRICMDRTSELICARRCQ